MPRVESGAKLWRVPRVIDGHLVLDETDIVSVFEVVSQLNPITADSKVMEQAKNQFQSALDHLKIGEKVQIIVDCGRYEPNEDLEKFRATISDKATPGFRTYYPNLLEDYVRNYCVLNMVPVFRYFVLFTYKAPNVFGAADSTAGNLQSTQNEVRRRGEDFAKLLGRDTLSCKPLSRQDIVDLVDSAANPTRLTKLPVEALDRAQGATGVDADGAELLFRSPVVNTVPRTDRMYSLLQVGRKLVKTIGFRQAPMPDNQLDSVIPALMMGQQEFRLSFYIEGVSQDRAIQIVQQRRRAAMGAVSFGNGKGTQAAEEQAFEYDSLIRQHARKELRYIRWSAYLAVFADDEKSLHPAAKDLAGAFVSLVPDEGTYRQVEFWRSSLPLCTDVANDALLVQTNAVKDLLPFFEFRSSSPEGGVLLGFSPVNQPVFFDPWSQSVPNGNVFITGQAGSGKSYLVNTIINRLGPLGLDVTFIDMAKSYKSTCLALGGSYIEFDLNGRQSVNVWDLLEYNPAFEDLGLNDVTKDGKVQPDKIADVAGLAEILLAEPGQSLSALEMSVLLQDVAETYARVLKKVKGLVSPDTVPTFADLAETLSERLDEKDKDPKHDFSGVRKDLLQKLSPAIDGTLSALVNRRTTLDAGAKVRVFDISNLPNSPMILSVANYVLASWSYRHWKRNKAKGIRQIGVVDEMAMIMRTRAGRDLLANLARRSRHLGLMPFFATQELADVLQYPETTAILNNCKTQFLFSQARNVIDKITDILSLTDQERTHLENLQQVRGEYSTAFFIYGKKRNILTIRPDQATRWLNTTEPTYDVPRVNAALERSGGDIWDAVKSLIAGAKS